MAIFAVPRSRDVMAALKEQKPACFAETLGTIASDCPTPLLAASTLFATGTQKDSRETLTLAHHVQEDAEGGWSIAKDRIIPGLFRKPRFRHICIHGVMSMSKHKVGAIQVAAPSSTRIDSDES